MSTSGDTCDSVLHDLVPKNLKIHVDSVDGQNIYV